MKYRFKTKQEFEKEFGKNWRKEMSYYPNSRSISWSIGMDYLLGLQCPEDIEKSPNKVHYLPANMMLSRKYWIISPLMITKILEPDYSPRKIIKEI